MSGTNPIYKLAQHFITEKENFFLITLPYSAVALVGAWVLFSETGHPRRLEDDMITMTAFCDKYGGDMTAANDMLRAANQFNVFLLQVAKGKIDIE